MSPIEAYTERYGSSYKWLATVTVMLSTIVTTATSTMVNVALPDIMGAFGMSQDQIQWLSTGFLAAMTATMLLTAWTLGRFGYRVSLLTAMTIFVAGSIIGATSSSGGEIILARVMQGMASGMIQPVAMVVMFEVFPREQRGKAMGIYTLGIVLAPALGPTFGGYLIDEYSWQYVFLAIVPVCFMAMLATSTFMPGRDVRRDKSSFHFDVVGFVFLSAFLVFLLSGLSNGQRLGWNSFPIIGLFAAAIVCAIVFITWELTCLTPLLNLRVFKVFSFSASCMVAFALGVGIFGSTYIVPMFVQFVQGYTPTRSGLLLMPAGFALALVSPLAGHLGDRLPPWVPIMIGLSLFGVSNVLCSGVDVDTSFWILSGWIVMGRVGLGLITPSLNAGALRALPLEMLAQGSGAVNFVRQLGGAIGVNILSMVVDRREAFHGDAFAQALTPANPAFNAAVMQLSQLYSHWGNPFGSRVPGAPPAAFSYLESMIAYKAQLFAYQDGFFVVSLIFFAALLPALLMRTRKGR